jgi:ubiquinone/menaquinone biosynthesis C-methylase UbiE
MIFKKRVPEPSEEMEGMKEAKNYFLAHRNENSKGSPYDYAARDALRNARFQKAKVLDVGCGYGALIKLIRHYKPNFKFNGIDMSKSMIKLAKGYVKGADFRVMRADKMKFKDNSFDLIVCKDTVHHFGNPSKVFREMLRVLKVGGKIYLLDLDRGVSDKIFYEVLQFLTENNQINASQYNDSVRAAYTIEEIKGILRKLGIKKYKISKSKKIKGLGLESYYKGHWTLVISK